MNTKYATHAVRTIALPFNCSKKIGIINVNDVTWRWSLYFSHSSSAHYVCTDGEKTGQHNYRIFILPAERRTLSYKLIVRRAATAFESQRQAIRVDDASAHLITAPNQLTFYTIYFFFFFFVSAHAVRIETDHNRISENNQLIRSEMILFVLSLKYE